MSSTSHIQITLPRDLEASCRSCSGYYAAVDDTKRRFALTSAVRTWIRYKTYRASLDEWNTINSALKAMATKNTPATDSAHQLSKYIDEQLEAISQSMSARSQSASTPVEVPIPYDSTIQSVLSLVDLIPDETRRKQTSTILKLWGKKGLEVKIPKEAREDLMKDLSDMYQLVKGDLGGSASKISEVWRFIGSLEEVSSEQSVAKDDREVVDDDQILPA